MARCNGLIVCNEALNQKKSAGLRKHQNNFKFLCSCINSLSPELIRLFSNVEFVAYVPKNRLRYNGSTRFPPDFRKPDICVYPLVFRHPPTLRKDYIFKLLAHELSHSLDFTSHGLAVVPHEFHEGITEEEWLDVLRAEPESPEYFPGCSESFRRYSRKPREQWAVRMALTIISDLMAPERLISANNVSRTPKILSVLEFKEKWPKSYQFFHKYIQTILAHAPKNLSK